MLLSCFKYLQLFALVHTAPWPTVCYSPCTGLRWPVPAMVRYPGFSANLAMLFQDGVVRGWTHMPQMAVSCCVSWCVSSVSKLLESLTCHQDVPLLERFARARSAGFGAVEISSNELFEHCPKEAETVGWRWGRSLG